MEEAYKYMPIGLPTVSVMMQSHEMHVRRLAELAASYAELKSSLDRYIRKSRSNNWLKMHGYPMRRKSINNRRKSWLNELR